MNAQLTADPWRVDQAHATGLINSPFPVWAALFGNTLAFSGQPTLVPIPGFVGQVMTQGALILALLLALLANRSAVVRPSLFLVLLTILATVSLMASVHNEFLVSSTYRACRLIGFTLVLWLLTLWWGRSDYILLRAHIICLRVILVTVLVGAVVAPGAAFATPGRLSGALWPIPPPQVAHYAAVLLGCSVVLWFGGAMRSRTMWLTLVAASVTLIGTHTRTALFGMVIGLAVAGASMFLGHARVRRASALLGGLALLLATLFAPVIVGWLWRGQTTEDAMQLTGRTKVWSALLEVRRPWLEELFGSGLSNQSFNGLPIDSNWLATYLDQGWFGVFVDAALILVLILLAVTHRRGIRRAVALFLITYCVVTSITETGLGDATPYTLNLVVAASLLAAPIGTNSPAVTATELGHTYRRRPASLPSATRFLERPE